MNKSIIRAYGLLLALLLSWFGAFAHNPLSARYHLDASARGSVLTVNLSQAGLHDALLHTHERPALEGLTASAYEVLVLDYIKENFALSVNGQAFALDRGGIKLGTHQTDLKFVLPAIEGEIVDLDVSIPSFRENGQHQTIFSYGAAGTTEHVILDEGNEYRYTTRATKWANAGGLWWWLVPLALVAGLVVYRRHSDFGDSRLKVV